MAKRSYRLAMATRSSESGAMVNMIPREWCCIGPDYATEPAFGSTTFLPSGRTNFAGDVDGPSPFRESSFAQVAEILLGVLGRAEAPEGPLRSINRIRRLDSKDLRCLRTRFFQLPQSHIGGSQGSTTESRIGRSQDTATKQSQSITILIQHVACKTRYECCERRIERINSHMRLGDFNRPHEFAREHKRNSKPPVGKIGVQRDGPFECRDRFLRARPQRQRNSKLGVSHGQIGVKLHCLGAKIMRSFDSRGIKIVGVKGLTVSSGVRV